MITIRKTIGKTNNRNVRIAALPLVAALVSAINCSEQDFIVAVVLEHRDAPTATILQSERDKINLRITEGTIENGVTYVEPKCVEIGGGLPIAGLKPDNRLKFTIGCNSEHTVAITPREILMIPKNALEEVLFMFDVVDGGQIAVIREDSWLGTDSARENARRTESDIKYRIGPRGNSVTVGDWDK